MGGGGGGARSWGWGGSPCPPHWPLPVARATQSALAGELVSGTAFGEALGGACRLLRGVQKGRVRRAGKEGAHLAPGGCRARPRRRAAGMSSRYDLAKRTGSWGGKARLLGTPAARPTVGRSVWRRREEGVTGGAGPEPFLPVARGLMADGSMGRPGVGLGLSDPALAALFHLPAGAAVGQQRHRKRQKGGASGRASRTP